MSEYPLWIAKSKPNSIATISAQPILRPYLFHPELNFHASHSPLNITPIPQDDDASTQNSIVEVVGGFNKKEPQKERESCVRHQSRSERTLGLGVLRTKGDEEKLKEAVNRDKAGRRERPSGTAKEQWTSVPKTDSASFLENF